MTSQLQQHVNLSKHYINIPQKTKERKTKQTNINNDLPNHHALQLTSLTHDHAQSDEILHPKNATANVRHSFNKSVFYKQQTTNHIQIIRENI
jgi:hypothetical protein